MKTTRSFLLWRLASAFLLATGLFLLSFLWLLGNPLTLHAAGPRYVASGDGDSSNCSISNPCRTIQRAVTTQSDFEADSQPQLGTYNVGAGARLQIRNLLFYADEEFTTIAPDTVVFTHTLVNTGDITDTFSLTYSSTYPWPTTFEQPMPYTVTLGAGVSHSVPVTIEVPPDANGQVNTTVITATSSMSSVSAAVVDTIYVRSAKWQISKTVTPAVTVHPGEYLTYTLTVTNNGDLSTSGVYTITDPLPAHTRFIRAAPSPVLTSPTVTWVDEAPLAEGESITRTYVVSVTPHLADGTQIVNQAYRVVGGSAYNRSGGAPVLLTVEAPAVLSITKTASHDPVRPGDWLTYTLTISNDAAAPGPALGVIISDTLPADVVYQSMGFVPPASGVFTPTASPLLVWQLADPISPGGRSQVTATVRVTSPLAADMLLANTYAVTAANLAAPVSGTTTTAVTSSNSISLHKTVAPAIVAAGGTVTYTITLTNSGDGLATAALTDVLHPDFSPNSYSTNVLVPGRTWSTGEGVTTTSFTVTAPLLAGVYYNQWITATYDLTQAVAISHTAPVSVVVPMLALSKESVPNPVPAGTPLTYTLHVTNSGEVTLTNVVVTDTLPAHVTPAGPLTWTPGIITPDAVWTQTVVVDVEAGYTGTLTNVIQVTTKEGATGIFTQTTPVFNAAIEVGKEANVETASMGQTITYTYRVTNTGSITLTNISAEDDRLGAISLLTTTLAPGASTTGTVTYLVQESDLPGPLDNTVLVTGSGTPPFSAVVTGTAGASVDLTFNAAIAIAKTPDSQTVAIDGTAAFTLAVANTGEVTLANVVVSDTLVPDCSRTLTELAPGGSGSYNCAATHVVTDFINTALVTGTLPFALEVTAVDTATVNVEEAISGLIATNDSPTLLGNSTTLTASVAAGENVVYTWALGDGTGGGGAVVSHLYPSAGVYTAVITASNSVSELTATTIVTITDVPITGLEATNDSPTALGSPTSLTATITAGSNVTYTWAFGEGTGGGGALVTHTYSATGTYT
ncbi:MAG: PKD domain-containing protein, partial [Anaerolineae bacterium]